ncbi:MAG: hypothetical protein JXX29_14075 [Deltaproteobacteria bacterium]|nr:hypothetical protein [Deltaproteobacteria bacterium]MBN2672805.1 hypothetical protein [Deltaproteobacteria bacterium]
MRNAFLISIVVIFVSACELDDSERCSAPYEYVEAEAACIIPVDTDVPEPVDTSPVQEGLGEPCQGDSDCSVYAPDGPVFCLLDPTNPTAAGMCTFTECDYAACGGQFECCNCENSTTAAGMFDYSLVFCVDPGSAALLATIGCACE